MEAVVRLDYRPNEIARSLREQKSRQIGIILPNLYDPFFGICAHTIGQVAKLHKYSAIVALSEGDPSIELEEAGRLLRRNIDGLIMIPAKERSEMLGPEFDGTPIVTLDRPIAKSSYDHVLVRNQAAAKEAVQHLLAHGHKRIAYIGLSNGAYTLRRRLAGYRAAMSEANLQSTEVLVGDSLEEMLAGVRQLMDQSNAPTAMFCSNNLSTRNTLHVLAILGIRMPEQIALVGFDDFEMADLIKPSITVVRQDPAGMARLAAEMLMTRVLAADTDIPTRSVTLPVQLVVRDSCGAHPIKLTTR
jgi:LacI family transcriptional regulator